MTELSPHRHLEHYYDVGALPPAFAEYGRVVKSGGEALFRELTDEL